MKSQLWIHKLAVIATALLLILQVPFLLTHASADRALFGMYSYKYAVLLIVYLLLCAGIIGAAWQALRLTLEGYDHLRLRLDPYAGWLFAVTAMLPATIYGGWVLIDLFFSGVLIGGVFWPVVLCLAAVISAAPLLPDHLPAPLDSAFQRIGQVMMRLASGVWARALMLGGILAACVPPLWMAWRVMPIGEQTLSNDLMDWMPLITRVLGGGYDWSHLFRDSLLNGHPLPVPALLQIANAALFRWNHDALLIEGLVISGVVGVMIAAILAKIAPDVPRWLTLPLISLLLYHPVHISTYSFGFSAIQIAISNFGFVLGLWALIGFGPSWRAAALICAGGLIAAWSGGLGFGAWPLYLIGLAVQQDRQPLRYLLILAVMLISTLPLFIDAPTAERAAHLSLNLLSPSPLAWTFHHLSDITDLDRLGGMVLLVLLLGGVLTLAQPPDTRRRLTIGWMLIAYALGGMVLTVVFRPRLLPWYSSYFVFEWIGVVALMAVFAQQAGAFQRLAILGASWAVGALGVMAALMLTYQLNSIDHQYFPYRAPVASACWLHYATAPEHCEDLVTQRTIGEETWAERAAMLEQQRLSVFAPQQRWTMQGDTVIDAVSYDGSVMWVRNQTLSQPIDPTDYHRLNLAIHGSGAATWEITLPENASQVVLHTGILMGDESVLIEVESAGLKDVLYAGRSGASGSISIPLDAYIGQTVRIIFSASGAEEAWVLFRYPYLKVTIP